MLPDLERLLELQFTRDHEWVHLQDSYATVGISDFAQSELSDIVFVELPNTGAIVEPGGSLGTVESVKTVGEIYAPFGGRITETNTRLESAPELVNAAPFSDGWIVRLQADRARTSEGLLDYIQYRRYCASGFERFLMRDENGYVRCYEGISLPSSIVEGSRGPSPVLVSPSIIAPPVLTGDEAVRDFEYLLNRPQSSESDFQGFLQTHKGFLLGVEYDELFSQVVLKSGLQGMRPDFILRPISGTSYPPRIVELKLPKSRLLKRRTHHPSFLSYLKDGIEQLHRYGDAIRSDVEAQQRVQQQLGFEAYGADLTLVIGRRADCLDGKAAQDLLVHRSPSIQLLTYEDLLVRYKRLLDSGRD